MTLFVESIGSLISNTGRKLSSLLTSRFQHGGLTSEQWSVLNRLCGGDGITQKELAGRVDKDPTNLTRILDQLERKGLIRREANRSDRRSFRLTVTERGRELDRLLAPLEREFVAQLLEGVSEAEQATLRAVLSRINANADRMRVNREA